MGDVMAWADRATNGELIADVARLGWLKEGWDILDPTYGQGTFWSVWKPTASKLWTSDIAPAEMYVEEADFRKLPWKDRRFDAVVFDPPYKLNGTPSGPDERYGVDEPTRWQDRMELIRLGTLECARVAKTMLLVKCMDQVCSGKVRWQTDLVTEAAAQAGFDKVDRLDFPSFREQPAGRRQVHARRNHSTMLVFKRKPNRRPRAQA